MDTMQVADLIQENFQVVSVPSQVVNTNPSDSQVYNCD